MRDEETQYSTSNLMRSIMDLHIRGLSEEVASNVVKAVQDKGLKECWQVARLSQDIINEWFPQGTALLESLAINQIQNAIPKEPIPLGHRIRTRLC